MNKNTPKPGTQPDIIQPKLPVPRNEKGQFLKGVSGNPTGRGARLYPDHNGNMVTEQELFRQRAPEVVELLWETINSPDTKGAVKFNCFKLWFDRAWGTAKQQIQHTVGAGDDDTFAAHRMSMLSPELIKQLAEQIEQNEDYIDVTPQDDDDC